MLKNINWFTTVFMSMFVLAVFYLGYSVVRLDKLDKEIICEYYDKPEIVIVKDCSLP